jgi:nucleoside 2-deoxyribosyltransferase
MLGCDYGIAILEDRVGNEFNPNVALEYGFMLARGSKVVLLKEANFKHIRADILATIPAPFSINQEHVVDTHSVRNAISDWLSVDLGLAPRRKR